MIARLTLKEKIAFRFIFNKARVYQRWFGRFFVFGIDYGRLNRVVDRIPTWFKWCSEWSKEGEQVEKLAEEALEQGHLVSAVALFHQSVACYHIGQHIFFIDPDQKEKAQARARHCYCRAIELYPDDVRPIRVEIPFEDTFIPGYLRRTARPGQPLLIYVNGMDNIKEAENHFFGNHMILNGLNFFGFDGPGQGEMWKSKKFMLNYEKAVSTIINWFENNNPYGLDLSRIAIAGFSLGGFLAPWCAAHDRRICCAVGNSGFARIGGVEGARKCNPIWQRGIMYMTGCDDFGEAVKRFDLDITKAPPLDRPFLFFHAGRDEVMPSPKLQADTFMDWAKGEKELKYYPEAEHCTVDRLDEVFPYIVDWLKKQLLK